jgi:exodeoxyribonuclease VIII
MEPMIHYDMPESVYHASLHLGQSTLKLAHKSLRLMKDKLDGIYQPSQSPAMGLGSIIHKMVLQPGTIKTTDAGPVNSRTGKPYGRDTMAFADWQAEHADVVVVDPWVRTMLDRMPTEIGDIFAAGKPEVSILREETKTGLLIKCRADSVDGMATITDLKTTNDCDGDAIDREIRRHMYWFQEAFYRRLFLQETGETHRFQFVFCEKKPPFRWRVVSMTADYNLWANSQVQNVMDRIARAQVSGNWSDDTGIDLLVGMPQYMTDDEDVSTNENGGIDI